jgi:hypothetical protein
MTFNKKKKIHKRDSPKFHLQTFNSQKNLRRWLKCLLNIGLCAALY